LKAAAVAAPSVELHTIPGADHALPLRADAILPILGAWLEKISG
jgi:hypothetical protein